MATNLKDSKPVVRRVNIAQDNRVAERARDMATMTLYPNGVIGFRPNRSKDEYTISVSRVYQIAMRKFISESTPTRKTKTVSRGLLATERSSDG